MRTMTKLKGEIKISKSLKRRIDSKKYLLQFLPKSIELLKDIKTVTFRGKKIKTSYIIDIVNTLLLKYYFKRENKYSINATVLKDRYGHIYNLYMEWLIENRIIKLVSNHRKGVSSRVYSLDESIFSEKIYRYRNNDSVILKKWKSKVIDSILVSNSLSTIDSDIKNKLISDLFSAKIDVDRSVFFLDSLKENDIDTYNRNLYSVDSINERHIFYHFDNYGRLHTNFTILRSFIRKNCLMIDGMTTCEIDISNSQPLFLSKLISDIQSKWVDSDELDRFKYLTRSGNYYQYMMQELNVTNKSEIKEMTYKVFFGRNASRSKADIKFRSIFPTIHRFITLYKKEHGDYRVLAYKLQNMESKFIFNGVIRMIMNEIPDVKIITVHDSIIIPAKYRESVSAIFENKLNEEFDMVA